MRVTDLALQDWHNVPNALTRGQVAGAPNPAVVSFTVEWDGALDEREFRDQVNGFSLESVETDVRVEWSGRNTATGFSFTSNVGSRSTSIALGQTPFAMVGEERNGVFFEKGKKKHK